MGTEQVRTERVATGATFRGTQPSGDHACGKLAMGSALGLLLALALGPVSAQTLPMIGQAGTPGSAGLGSGLGPSTTALAPGSSEISAQVRASLLYSNNLGLRPDGVPQSGHTLTEVTPWVSYRAMTARGPIEVRGVLRGQVLQGNTDTTRLSAELAGSTDLRLSDDWLHMAARTGIQRVNINPFSASSADPATQINNTGTLRHVEISPYAQGDFGGDGQWQARYSMRYIDPGLNSSSVLLGSNIQQTLQMGLRSDLTRRPLGLSASGRSIRVDYQNGLGYQQGDMEVLGWWRASGSLRVGAGAGWFQHDLIRNREGSTESVGPVASLEWAPNARTSLKARWADQHTGEHLTTRLDHRVGRWNFGLSYFKGIQDGNSSILGNQINLAALMARAAQTGSLSEPLYPINAFINSPVVRTEQVNLIAGVQGARTTLQGTLFYSDRSSAVMIAGLTPADLRQMGAWLQGSYRIDGAQSVGLGLRHTVSDTAGGATQARLTTLTGSWDMRLTPRWGLSLGARWQQQTARGLASEYDEAGLFATTHYRFH